MPFRASTIAGVSFRKLRMPPKMAPVRSFWAPMRRTAWRSGSRPVSMARHHFRAWAAWDVPWKREKIEQVALLLAGALRAEAQVGLKMNVPPARLQEVIALLPAITAPTVAPLYGTDWFAVESVIGEATVRDLIPRLLRAGAVGIIEYPLNKIVG